MFRVIAGQSGDKLGLTKHLNQPIAVDQFLGVFFKGLHGLNDQRQHAPFKLTETRLRLLRFAGDQLLDTSKGEICEVVAEAGGAAPQIVRRAGAVEHEGLLFDDATVEDEHRQGHTLVNGDQFKMAKAQAFGGTRRRDDRSVLGGTGQNRACQLHPLIQFTTHLIELMADHPLFGQRQGCALHQVLDKKPVAGICGESPRRGMQVREVAEFLQGSEFVAHGGGRDIQPILAYQRLGGHRGCRCHKFLDHQLENALSPLRQTRRHGCRPTRCVFWQALPSFDC